MKNSPANRTFLFYQSIGLIPLDAKRSDWHLHHMDITLRERDPERYKQYNVYDVIPVPSIIHPRLHVGNHWHRSEETRKKDSEYAKQRVGEKNSFYGKHHSDETKERIRQAQLNRKPFGWKIDKETGKRVYYYK